VCPFSSASCAGDALALRQVELRSRQYGAAHDERRDARQRRPQRSAGHHHLARQDGDGPVGRKRTAVDGVEGEEPDQARPNGSLQVKAEASRDGRRESLHDGARQLLRFARALGTARIGNLRRGGRALGSQG